jgi:hypothetical protein
LSHVMSLSGPLPFSRNFWTQLRLKSKEIQ